MTYEPGDLFACHGMDRAARVIRWGTCSPWAPRGLRLGPSHVAVCGSMAVPGSELRQVVWIESTTLSRLPCLVRGEPTAGMQVHYPSQRIAEYRAAGGRVDLYRLAKIQALDDDEAALLNRILLEHFVRAGVRYDMRGAILSGARLLKWAGCLPSANLDQLFCSEVCAAVLMRLGRMNHENPTRFNPASLLRELVGQGVYYLAGKDIPA
jgi:hypothetical protein